MNAVTDNKLFSVENDCDWYYGFDKDSDCYYKFLDSSANDKKDADAAHITDALDIDLSLWNAPLNAAFGADVLKPSSKSPELNEDYYHTLNSAWLKWSPRSLIP